MEEVVERGGGGGGGGGGVWRWKGSGVSSRVPRGSSVISPSHLGVSVLHNTATVGLMQPPTYRSVLLITRPCIEQQELYILK